MKGAGIRRNEIIKVLLSVVVAERGAMACVLAIQFYDQFCQIFEERENGALEKVGIKWLDGILDD